LRKLRLRQELKAITTGSRQEQEMDMIGNSNRRTMTDDYKLAAGE
jgi:hypothetical protein